MESLASETKRAEDYTYYFPTENAVERMWYKTNGDIKFTQRYKDYLKESSESVLKYHVDAYYDEYYDTFTLPKAALKELTERVDHEE